MNLKEDGAQISAPFCFQETPL